MICKNCGNPIDEGHELCDVCARLGLDRMALNLDGEVPKKTSKKGMMIAAVAAVALCVLCVIFWGPVSRLFQQKTRFSTPQEHFVYVETQAAGVLADQLTAGYSKLLALSEKGTIAGSVEAHIQLSDPAFTMLRGYMELGEDVELSWLKDILVRADTITNVKGGQATVSVGLDEDAVVSADVIMDYAANELWFSVPELTDTYLELELADVLGNYLGFPVDLSALDPQFLLTFAKALPSEQSVHRLLETGSSAVLSQIIDVTGERQTITVNGISQECTVLTATIPEATVIQIGITLLETIKEDTAVLEAICQAANESGNGIQWSVDDLIERIDTLINDFREAQKLSNEQNFIQIIDYVDDDNHIIGRRLVVSGVKEDIHYFVLTDGDQYALEASILGSIVVSGSGSVTNQLLSGMFTVHILEKDSFAIELENLDIRKLMSGQLSGTVRVIPSDELVKEIFDIPVSVQLELEIVMDRVEQIQKMDIILRISDEVFATVFVKAAEAKPGEIDLPQKTIDNDNPDAMSLWTKTFDFKKVIANLKDSAAPDEIVTMIWIYLNMVQSGIHYSN